MKKKMRGMIEPYTLGFLISFIGGTAIFVAHKDDNNLETSQKTSVTEKIVTLQKHPEEQLNINIPLRSDGVE